MSNPSATSAAFNSGASVPDVLGSGSDAQPIAEWRTKNAIDVTKHIHIVRLVHMRYQHPNLDVIVQFLGEFGMSVVKKTLTQVWLRGYGPDPYVYYAQKGPKTFLGGTFLVESWNDLVKASQLDGAKGIEELEGAPAGGSLVTVIDPEGVPVNFIYGQQEDEVGILPEKLIINFEAEKPRKRSFQRFSEGPAAVFKVRFSSNSSKPPSTVKLAHINNSWVTLGSSFKISIVK